MAHSTVTRSAPVPADMEAHHEMWMAVLGLLLDDARDYLAKKPDKDGVRAAAYRAVTGCGPMLRWVCRFALLDPESVQRLFLMSLEPGKPRVALATP